MRISAARAAERKGARTTGRGMLACCASVGADGTGEGTNAPAALVLSYPSSFIAPLPLRGSGANPRSRAQTMTSPRLWTSSLA